MGPSEIPLAWNASMRLSHLRKELHDKVKHELGSGYVALFQGVPFAHRMAPKGTTDRLDAWCKKLAECISCGSVPPLITLITLSALAVPDTRQESIDTSSSAEAPKHSPPVGELSQKDEDALKKTAPAHLESFGPTCNGSATMVQSCTRTEVNDTALMPRESSGPATSSTESARRVSFDDQTTSIVQFDTNEQKDENVWNEVGLDSDSGSSDCSSSEHVDADNKALVDEDTAEKQTCLDADDRPGSESADVDTDITHARSDAVEDTPQAVSDAPVVAKEGSELTAVSLSCASSGSPERTASGGYPGTKDARSQSVVSDPNAAASKDRRKAANLEELAAEWKAKGISPQSSRWFIRGGHVLDMRDEFDVT
eukprot:TRINITY_DN57910_c0_g1_i1.p1 TRINITY_DN57910_c0_g1~~TRINITY_DN57910_c0_g1_i1.p1  ORF type:complete len:431 (-),score=46.05 TRINITY_DN57910_c0_g1_i1:29-1135(-)